MYTNIKEKGEGGEKETVRKEDDFFFSLAQKRKFQKHFFLKLEVSFSKGKIWSYVLQEITYLNKM